MSSATLGSVYSNVGLFKKHEVKISSGRNFWVGASAATSPTTLQIPNAKMQNSKELVRVGVLGASGYTGAEVLMRVEQEQKVTEDARTSAEQDAVAQRYAANVLQVDAAARETFVLNNKLDMIERLVSRLHATVESDKVLVRLVLEIGKGKGQQHPIMEVMRHLRKNHLSFMHQISNLDEHIVLCLAAVNRPRALLIQQIYC